jgi:hypothetical protein
MADMMIFTGKRQGLNTESKYGGMTVNERLSVAGLIDEWDVAAKSRNRDRMIEVLSKVELSQQAAEITDTVLANPRRYGF